MARRLFYPKQEILSKDFNQLRNTMEKAIFETFLGKAIPVLPAFIGNSMKPEQSGNSINLNPGIGFQRLAQSDGSTDVRLIILNAVHAVNFNLPSGSTVKTDMIECRSIIVNQASEDRRYKRGDAIVDESTVVSNQWSSEFRVVENVSQDANGNYNPSIGWVAVAIVRLNSVGISSFEDVRNFYNIFDPDFFSRYGRTNINFSVPFDGVRLHEVPFTFSDLVEKIKQINVRRRYRDVYGQINVVSSFQANFGLSSPVGAVSSLDNANPNFNGDRSNLMQVDSRNLIVGDVRLLRFSKENTKWSQGNYGEQDFWGVSVNPSYRGQNSLSRISGITRGTRDYIYSNVLDDVSSADINNMPVTGIYILASTSPNPTRQNSIIWNIPRSDLSQVSGNLRWSGRSYDPIFSAGPISHSYLYWRITTSNPLISIPGESRYLLLNPPINISNFYRVGNIIYDPRVKRIQVQLINTASGATEFPGGGVVFNRMRFFKGSESRLNLGIDDLDIQIVGTTATYSISLNALQNLLKDSDRSFNDFRIQFDRFDTRGEDIWKTTLLRRDVDFSVLEEGGRTYVRITGTYPFRIEDKIMFSHVVPQELIDLEAGTPEASNVEREVQNLRTELDSLKAEVNTNKGDISNLQSHTQADVSTTLLWNFTAVGARTRVTSTINARVAASIAAGGHNEEETSNLKTVGAKIDVAAPAAVGSYFVWVAVEKTRSNNIVFDDDELSWYLYSANGSVDIDIDGTIYHVFVRKTSLKEGQRKTFLIKDYE